MKTFNGYEVVDAKARQDIAELKEKEPDLSNYYTKAQTDSAIGEAVSGIEIPETDISGKADLVHQHSMADITDYVAPDIPSLDGYATEQYVDTAITNAPCKFEVIDIQGANSEKVPVQAGSDVLERIIAGEKFPFYLYKKDGAGRDTFILPDDFTPIGSSTVLMSRVSYSNIEETVALYNMDYTFSKTDSIWYVRFTYTEVK